ncbi:hypothetical protein BURPS305_1465 [Burkholderia pseudomallei 305]|nr:hypothetical protein BURPS305_1465 [Burkholderia pseudomallei 305]
MFARAAHACRGASRGGGAPVRHIAAAARASAVAAIRRTRALLRSDAPAT